MNTEHRPGEFTCKFCRKPVNNSSYGTNHRNHCPHCLHSVHVDTQTGDRLSACRGLMEPIAVSVRKKGEWEIIHRCNTCGIIRINRIAGDDSEASLVALALRPLTSLPFPIETLMG
jgi:ribosome biogenesis GTPase / thiamine phosphate phosphatase